MAARLRLLAGTPGLAQVRNAMRRDLGHFEHSLIQLEVGALAARDGWQVAFEPRPDPTATRVTDLRLTRGADRMLVEVKGFALDDFIRADLRSADATSMRFLALQLQHDVHFSGEVDSPTDAGALEQWFHDLSAIAADVGRDRHPRQSHPIFGGHILIAPGLPPAGTEHSMTIRRRDEWGRISDQIDLKA